MYYDADFIRALEYGLPPPPARLRYRPAGNLFTDSPSIRDVILFPQLRHQDYPDEGRVLKQVTAPVECQPGISNSPQR